jgi:putative FmdB family regulatory protein
MARYEYRCKTCDVTFEQRRAMSDADADATTTCPDGHRDVVRLLSMFASVGASSGSAGPSGSPAMPPSGAGCGGHCACH